VAVAHLWVLGYRLSVIGYQNINQKYIQMQFNAILSDLKRQ